MKTMMKNQKQNDSFLKRSFLKTIVFQKDCFYQISRFVNDC